MTAKYLHRTNTGERLSFARRSWLEAIYKDTSDRLVIRKPSQIGITEMLLVDMMTMCNAGKAGMYVLPTEKWMYAFVDNRIKAMIRNVPVYRAAMRIDRHAVESKAMMSFWNVNVKFCGANSENNFYEFPAGWIIIDENDQCDQANLVLVEDRLGAQDRAIVRRVGNPTVAGIGIDAELDSSDYCEWHVKCPACNEWQSPQWFTHVVEEIADNEFRLRDSEMQTTIDSLAADDNINAVMQTLVQQRNSHGRDANIYCAKCNGVLDRRAEGEWIAKYPGRPVRGYAVNKLWADFRSIAVVLEMYRVFIEASHRPIEMQRFYNKILGEPFEGEGARLTLAVLQSCAKEYSMPISLPATIDGHEYTSSVAGVDVGSDLHVHISGLRRDNGHTVRRKLFVGRATWTELDTLAKRYNVQKGVMDADPETVMAREFCRNHAGWNMCRFNFHLSERQVVKKPKERLVQVNRTEIFDASMDSFLTQRVELPISYRSLDEGNLVKQMLAPVRMFVDSQPGKPARFVWDEGGKPDHHRLADVYEYIATQLCGATDFGGMWI